MKELCTVSWIQMTGITSNHRHFYSHTHTNTHTLTSNYLFHDTGYLWNVICKAIGSMDHKRLLDDRNVTQSASDLITKCYSICTVIFYSDSKQTVEHITL